MALVRTWEELKRRERSDPAAAIAVQAGLSIARIVKGMVEGAQNLPPGADEKILDPIAKATAGAVQRAYRRAVATARRAAVRAVAEHEAERTRREVLKRLEKS